MTTGIEQVLPVLNHLRDLSRRPGLDEIGRLIALSPGHAQRVITRAAGESPDRYQRRLRLERAAALLLSTDDAVIDIALAVGFDSHEAFTRAFRRRFRTSPRRYRREAATRLAADQVARVTTVGPCIGVLAGAIKPTTPTDREHTMTDYIIDRTELSTVPVLFIRTRTDRTAVAETLGQSLPAVFGHVMAQGLAMAGPPFVRYLDSSPAFVTLEAGIPLVDPPPAPPTDSGIERGELPEGPAATTVHVGPYETIGAAHEALDRWMADRGETAAGAPWEIYLTDPAEVPDPAEWQTQVVWPLRPGS